MHNFVINSNESAWRKSGRLGLEQVNDPEDVIQQRYSKFFDIYCRNRDGNETSSVPSPYNPCCDVCLNTQVPTVTVPPNLRKDDPVQNNNKPDPAASDYDSDGDSKLFDKNFPPQ